MGWEAVGVAATIIIRSYNNFGVPPVDLAAARQDAQAVLQQAGVNIAWEDCWAGERHPAFTSARCQEPVGRDIVLRLQKTGEDRPVEVRLDGVLAGRNTRRRAVPRNRLCRSRRVGGSGGRYRHTPRARAGDCARDRPRAAQQQHARGKRIDARRLVPQGTTPQGRSGMAVPRSRGCAYSRRGARAIVQFQRCLFEIRTHFQGPFWRALACECA